MTKDEERRPRITRIDAKETQRKKNIRANSRHSRADLLYVSHSCYPCNPWLNFKKSPFFAETISWHFQRLAQCQLKLVGKRPLRVVWHGVGFDHALGSFWVDGEKWRRRQIAKVIEDDLLLFWII